MNLNAALLGALYVLGFVALAGAVAVGIAASYLGVAAVIAYRDQLRHPLARLDQWWADVSPRRRMDRNAGNMSMLVGLMLPSLSIILQGPTPNSAIIDMPTWLQIWMCAFIFGGCGIKLHGALSGSRYYFPRTPLKQSYRWGYVGAPMATTGALVYGYYILSGTPTFLSALGGVSTPAFGIGIGIQAGFYWLESRRIARNETALRSLRTDQ